MKVFGAMVTALHFRGKGHCTSGEKPLYLGGNGLYLAGRNVVLRGKDRCTSGEETLYFGGNKFFVSR